MTDETPVRPADDAEAAPDDGAERTDQEVEQTPPRSLLGVRPRSTLTPDGSSPEPTRRRTQTNYQCPIQDCTETSRDPRTLIAHWRREHNGMNTTDLQSLAADDFELHICTQCQNPFDTRQGLRRHAESCRGANPSSHCIRCSDTFASTRRLAAHIRRSHSNQHFHDDDELRSAGLAACRFCGLVWTRGRGVSNHARTCPLNTSEAATTPLTPRSRRPPRRAGEDAVEDRRMENRGHTERRIEEEEEREEETEVETAGIEEQETREEVSTFLGAGGLETREPTRTETVNSQPLGYPTELTGNCPLCGDPCDRWQCARCGPHALPPDAPTSDFLMNQLLREHPATFRAVMRQDVTHPALTNTGNYFTNCPTCGHGGPKNLANPRCDAILCPSCGTHYCFHCNAPGTRDQYNGVGHNLPGDTPHYGHAGWNPHHHRFSTWSGWCRLRWQADEGPNSLGRPDGPTTVPAPPADTDVPAEDEGHNPGATANVTAMSASTTNATNADTAPNSCTVCTAPTTTASICQACIDCFSSPANDEVGVGDDNATCMVCLEAPGVALDCDNSHRLCDSCADDWFQINCSCPECGAEVTSYHGNAICCVCTQRVGVPLECNDSHSVCSACAQRWFQESSTCPMCRAEVTNYNGLPIARTRQRPNTSQDEDFARSLAEDRDSDDA
jgi:hypothetical protein